MSVVTGSVTNADFHTKIWEVQKYPSHAKYSTATEFNKFSGEIFNAKIETNADLSNAEDRAIKNKK